jgi:hypothetical protein
MGLQLRIGRPYTAMEVFDAVRGGAFEQTDYNAAEVL